MRSKYQRRATPPPPPRRSQRPRQAAVGLILLAFGATVALSAQWLVTKATGPGATATLPPSAAPTPASSPLPSATAAASSAAPSPSPAAPLLEALMPRSVNGTTLTIQSTRNASSLGGDPSSRALSAAMTSLGKQPNNLEIAEAYDPAGALALTVLGFRVAGVDPARLRSIVLDSWLAIHAPGVTSAPVSLSGTPSTSVSYGDGGPNEYVFVHGDSVFVVVTPDQALAASAVAATAPTAPSPSPSRSPSPSPSGG